MMPLTSVPYILQPHKESIGIITPLLYFFPILTQEFPDSQFQRLSSDNVILTLALMKLSKSKVF